MSLYDVLIGPVEWVMAQMLGVAYALTGSHGASVILLSVAVNLLLIPAHRFAERRKKKEREIRAAMQPEIDKIDAYYHGQERYYYIRAIRRRYQYGALAPLAASLGLLIQVPLFLAAYNLLANHEPHRGASFLGIADLSQPDGLLGGSNLLPFLMTAANLAALALYARQTTSSERKQLLVLTLAFLLVLYDAAAGLLVYWTTSNVYALVRSALRWWRAPAAPVPEPSPPPRPVAPPAPARSRAWSWALVLLAGLFPAAYLIRSNLVMVPRASDGLIVVAVFVGIALVVYALARLSSRWIPPALAAFVSAVVTIAYSFTSTFTELGVYAEAAPARNVAIFLVIVGSAYWFIQRVRLDVRLACFVLLCLTLAATVDAALRAEPVVPHRLRVKRAISRATFQRKPNIYFILPDSYASIDTFEKLGIDISGFTNGLRERGFQLYPKFFASYQSTATTMSSSLNMTHHYFRNSQSKEEVFGARAIVSGRNNLNQLLRKNGYHTQVVQSSLYFFASEVCEWDSCWPTSRLPILLHETVIPNGLFTPEVNTDVFRAQIATVLADAPFTQPTFTYIHDMRLPGHTHNRGNCDSALETRLYIERVADANAWVEDLVGTIIERDPNAIIMVVSDHGPYLTEGCTHLPGVPTDFFPLQDRQSAFAAIRWGGEPAPEPYNSRILTTSTMFAVLAAYLADDPTILDHTVEDSSFIKIKRKVYQTVENGAPLWPIRRLMRGNKREPVVAQTPPTEN